MVAKYFDGAELYLNVVTVLRVTEEGSTIGQFHFAK